MEKLTTCIYKFLWQLLHYLFSLYEFCLWLRLRIIAFCLWSYDRFQTQLEREQNEYDFLQKCKKNLSKIPKHLNLIIGPDNTQMNDKLLTRIFTYAIHMNINCISYYDTRYTNPTNSIKSRLITLEKLNCPKGWKRKDLDTHHSIWYISNDNVTNGVKPSGNGVINGTTNASKSTITNGHLTNSLSNASLEIYEIQPQNNRSLLAQICRDLFKQRNSTEIQKLLEQRTSLTERLTQEFARHLENLTEPELSIIFDNNYCTFGMLPWHTRFTEFHLHVNGQRFDVKTFAHILYKYSRCEQRWGK
ncbi:transport and golgi organization 14 [Cochliomyia hominivorax]